MTAGISSRHRPRDAATADADDDGLRRRPPRTRRREAFRALFLFTLTPTKGSLAGAVGEYAVNGGTVLYNSLDKYCGASNLLYVGSVAAAARALRSLAVFLVATQYVP